MKTLTLKLPDGLVAEIEGTALARDVNPSVVVREWLERGKPGWKRLDGLMVMEEAMSDEMEEGRVRVRERGRRL
jgi:hypothetical protein